MARAMDIEDDVKALNLGSQVRQLRQKKGLTLQNVADLTGMSKPLLSQIENNVAAPPIATLLKISKALGVNIGYFFQDSPSADRIAVVRRNERIDAMGRKHHEANALGYRYQSLAYPMVDKAMEPFMVEIKPRREGKVIFYNHRGEEFLHVMEGKVEFRTPERVFVLEIGDSIYFDSSLPHALRGLEGKTAKALVVVYST